MGRRKISMKKIEDLHARQICFSKRRKGLLSKSTELYNQGGGELAAIMFSSAGNPYCYGWPSVDSVVRRYFKRRFAAAAAAAAGGKEGGGGRWWDVPLEGLEPHELAVLHAMLGELKEKAAKRAAWLHGGEVGDSGLCLELSLKPPC